MLDHFTGRKKFPFIASYALQLSEGLQKEVTVESAKHRELVIIIVSLFSLDQSLVAGLVGSDVDGISAIH